MPRRRKLLLAFALLLPATAGGIWYLRSGDSLEAASMKIQLGMLKADALAVIAPYQAESDRLKRLGHCPFLPDGAAVERWEVEASSSGAYDEQETWFSQHTSVRVSFSPDQRVSAVAIHSYPTAWEQIRKWLHRKLGF